jgi:hypothetical protein
MVNVGQAPSGQVPIRCDLIKRNGASEAWFGGGQSLPPSLVKRLSFTIEGIALAG